MKKVEDSSPMDHTQLLNDFIPTTPRRVSHLQASFKRQKIPPYAHPPPSEFSIILSGSYSCTYPLRIEHACAVEKGRDSDRERGQGQPEARASPEKVEKEVKKTRGTSHPERFEARAPNGHHIYYILLLFVRLACKSTLCLFSFLFKWL